MNFFDIYTQYQQENISRHSDRVASGAVLQSIAAADPGPHDLLTFLSPAAGEYLENMAQRAHTLTLQHFGRAIVLYTPMYIANYCVNQCLYCGFNAANRIPRKKLSLADIEKEAVYIAGLGLRHVLVLTGESREHSPLSYIKECIGVLNRYFSSVSIEIYPLNEDEYRSMIDCGVDGLTIYQEVYDEAVYDRVHAAGPKKDYRFRLEAPERAGLAKMRTINIGALLGLHDWRSEAFFMGMHARYLQDRFPECEVSVSVPRLCPHVNNYREGLPVSDAELVQIILALRIFMPRLGITLSTRESAYLRDRLLPLGITKMSAGSSTAVGGHTIDEPGVRQFDIADQRSVNEIKHTLTAAGYQPVLKDWVGAVS